MLLLEEYKKQNRPVFLYHDCKAEPAKQVELQWH